MIKQRIIDKGKILNTQYPKGDPFISVHTVSVTKGKVYIKNRMLEYILDIMNIAILDKRVHDPRAKDIFVITQHKDVQEAIDNPKRIDELIKQLQDAKLQAFGPDRILCVANVKKAGRAVFLDKEGKQHETS